MKQTSMLAWLIGAAVASFFWATYSGPYRWIAEWEIRTFSSYSAFWTFAALWALIAAGLDQIIKAVRRTPPGAEEAPSVGWLYCIEQQSGKFYQLAAGGIALIGIGGYTAWNSWQAEQKGLCQIALSALEAGQARTSDWIEVSGTLLWDDCWILERKRTETYYVPLVSSNWNRGKPVTAFVQYTESEADALGDFATVQGMVERGGMPGPIHQGFVTDGPAPAPHSILINANITPAASRMMAWPLMLFGVGLIVGSFFLYEPVTRKAAQFAAVEAVDATDGSSTPKRFRLEDFQHWKDPTATPEDCNAAVDDWLKAHNFAVSSPRKEEAPQETPLQTQGSVS